MDSLRSSEGPSMDRMRRDDESVGQSGGCDEEDGVCGVGKERSCISSWSCSIIEKSVN